MSGSYRWSLSAVAIAVLLSACGAGGGSSAGGGGSSPGDPVFITSFSVTGTSPPVNGVAPINPGVNSGAFTITWTVTGNQTYTARVSLSTDATYNDPGDISITNGSCGKASGADNCHPSSTLNCTFNNSNMMSCTDGYGIWGPVDLTTFLGGTGIPANLYFVIKACNPLGDSCPTASGAIQIQ